MIASTLYIGVVPAAVILVIAWILWHVFAKSPPDDKNVEQCRHVRLLPEQEPYDWERDT